jgi:peptide/nickel transport system substrate-binding protein
MRNLSSKTLPALAVPLLLLVAVACGTADPPTPLPEATAPPVMTNGDTPTPTAVPDAAQQPDGTQPTGTLNMGQKELGTFAGHPLVTSSPRIQFMSASIGEGMNMIDRELNPVPLLAESWDISDDFQTWTFNIRQGVQLHKGYGEMTAEDVLYSYEQWGEGALHARSSFIRNFWTDPDGSVEMPDSHTLVVNTSEPWVDVQIFEFMRNHGGSSTWVVSKEQSEELGVDAANLDTAATGPWEIEEHRTAQFWRFRAVKDHWRQTPHFEELVFWEIPEESARVAGFQTGQLDTFDMAFDSIASIEATPGARLLSVPNSGQMGVNIYGQLYTFLGTPDEYSAYDPSLPWVSGNPDPESEEWINAAKARQALSIAVDREAIVDTLLAGFGQPIVMRDWAGHEHRLPEHWTAEFDPDWARELLAEAGYPNGFNITVTTAIRGAPAETEVCEAMGTMWGDVGINVNFQRVPYDTLRPSLINRTYLGVTCHAVGIRLAPIIGASNYISESVFSYGTEHPFLEENVTAGLREVDPAVREQIEFEVYDFMYRHGMAFGLYSWDAVWPVGSRIDEWEPIDFSEIRPPSHFEYIPHRE